MEVTRLHACRPSFTQSEPSCSNLAHVSQLTPIRIMRIPTAGPRETVWKCTSHILNQPIHLFVVMVPIAVIPTDF